MSLRTRLRISIVALVAVVIVALSALYLYDFTKLALEAASAGATLVAHQVQGYVLERIDQQTSALPVRPATLEESKRAWREIVKNDPLIPAMLRRTLANAEVIVDIHISGEDGAILVSTGPGTARGSGPILDLSKVEQRNAFVNLWDLLTKQENYSKTLPLGVPGQARPVFRITVMMRSTLLWSALRPSFWKLALAFSAALITATVIASVLPNLILNSLDRLSHQIDRIRTGEFEAYPPSRSHETREFAAVESKLNLLGQQFRGAKQDAQELRSGVEEMLQRLEETVLLFDSSGRLMLAGEPAQRFLGRARSDLVGRRVDELFPDSTVLGAVIRDAIQRHEPLHDRLVVIDRNGERTHLLVNLDLVRSNESEREIGTLITLRDAETRRQIELQIDVSSRLAAISRLTAGVAHEIKNPLNAMALHLEVLRSQLEEGNAEVDVISREIKRLDNVVKTFLSFNKPIELQARPLDLSQLVDEIVHLIGPDARSKGVAFETHLNAPCWINGDADLLKQAVLNVVINAVEAMQKGGRVTIDTEEPGSECLLRVSDNGPGIAPEIQDKIFNLYFSTKKSGSGIGLAMAFRVVQLHSGEIDFSSQPGRGTSFRLRFPALSRFKDPPAARRAQA